MSEKSMYTQHQEKLELLFLLDHFSTEIETDQIWRAVSELNLMPYLDFVEYLDVLQKSNMISRQQDGTRDYYSVAEKGKSILREFTIDIGKSVRDCIEEYVKNHKKKYISERDFSAELSETEDGQYAVSFKMFYEHTEVFSLLITFKTKDEARSAVNRWIKTGSDIYSDIYDMFI